MEARGTAGGTLSLVLRESVSHRGQKCKEIKVSSETVRVPLFLGHLVCAEVKRGEAGPRDCKEPGDEGPGHHTVEPGCCLVGHGELLEGLTGRNGV